MAKSTSQQIIKHFQNLLNNDDVVDFLISRNGELDGAMRKQAQDILNSDGTFCKVTGGNIDCKGGNVVLSLITEGRERPQFVLMSSNMFK